MSSDATASMYLGPTLVIEITNVMQDQSHPKRISIKIKGCAN